MIVIEHHDQMNDSPAGVRLALTGHAALVVAELAPSEVVLHYSHKLVVAKIEQKAIGVIVWDKQDHTRDCFIQLSYVIPEYRRRGVYRKLYSALVEKAQELKLRTVTSGIALANEAMLQTAERMGRRPYATYFRDEIGDKHE